VIRAVTDLAVRVALRITQESESRRSDTRSQTSARTLPLLVPDLNGVSNEGLSPVAPVF
jgi:hypothetical protein